MIGSEIPDNKTKADERFVKINSMKIGCPCSGLLLFGPPYNENWDSYPVLRVHNLQGKEIGGRIDGNRVAGRIPVSQMLEQFKTAKAAFAL